MKNSRIAVRSILAGALVALVASCGDKGNTTAPVAATSQDSTATSCRIAYIEADSIIQHYTLARELTEESQRMMLRLQQQGQAKQRDLEAKAANIENKRQRNIYLSEASFQSDVQELQQAQAEAERTLNAQQAQVQDAMLRSQQRINDSIQNCIKSMNATLGYDAILLSESGVFFNPNMNITAQVIAELNRRYQSSAPAAN